MIDTTIVDEIVEIEREMFMSVYSTVKAPCQDRLKMFAAMRRMHHSVLSEETLAALLANLKRARDRGVNLMTVKYARMENQISPLKDSPLIAEIVKIEQNWMDEVAEKYPRIFTGEKRDGFSNYLSCELEVMSDEALGCYHTDIVTAVVEKRNLVEERYDNLFKTLGYESLEARNAAGE